MPPDGPELDARREALKAYGAEWGNIVTSISGHSLIEVINVDLFSKPEEGDIVKFTEEDMLKQCCASLESTYTLCSH